MPWKEINVMDQRAQFIALAREGQRTITDLAYEFAISRKTAYKWLKRVDDKGLVEGLQEASRRPRRITLKVAPEVEQKIVQLRKKHLSWGARKLRKLYGEVNPDGIIPAERTVNRILERNGLVAEEDRHQQATKRFEACAPNDMWQMDYKGEFSYGSKKKQYCYPLTVLDDHSRYNLCLSAHTRPSWVETKRDLEMLFRQNGLPETILMDHGSIWYASTGKYIPWTRLTVWIMLLGVKVVYSGIRHPQTQGKVERFHRTLKYDLIRRNSYLELKEIQDSFDAFRQEYNDIRPHESLGLRRPSELYVTSRRAFPLREPVVNYPEGAVVKKLNSCGVLHYKSQQWFVSEALAGHNVMLITKGELVEVYFVNSLVRVLDLKERVTY